MFCPWTAMLQSKLFYPSLSMPITHELWAITLFQASSCVFNLSSDLISTANPLLSIHRRWRELTQIGLLSLLSERTIRNTSTWWKERLLTCSILSWNPVRKEMHVYFVMHQDGTAFTDMHWLNWHEIGLSICVRLTWY